MNAHPDSHYTQYGGMEWNTDPRPREIDQRSPAQVLSDLYRAACIMRQEIIYLRGKVGTLEADVAELLKWRRMMEGDHR